MRNSGVASLTVWFRYASFNIFIYIQLIRFAHDYIFVLFLYAALRLPPTMTSKG